MNYSELLSDELNYENERAAMSSLLSITSALEILQDPDVQAQLPTEELEKLGELLQHRGSEFEELAEQRKFEAYYEENVKPQWDAMFDAMLHGKPEDAEKLARELFGE